MDGWMDGWVNIDSSIYNCPPGGTTHADSSNLKEPLPISILSTRADERAGEKTNRQTDKQREDWW